MRGKVIDKQTRCSHYHSDLDIIAIKFKCCDIYYPCYSCHQEDQNHIPQRWQKNEFDTLAILCGVCKKELSIQQYLDCDATCIFCKSAFNPKCSTHYDLYFE